MAKPLGDELKLGIFQQNILAYPHYSINIIDEKPKCPTQHPQTCQPHENCFVMQFAQFVNVNKFINSVIQWFYKRA